MNNDNDTSYSGIRELVFQIALNILVFTFFAFDRRLPGIEIHKVFFYLNFALASQVINYVLLPKYLYKNRYWQFAAFTILIVAAAIFVEEAILEQIFYPETRAKRFLGVFFNLLSTLPTITILVGFKFAWDALKKQREVLELKNAVKESELQYLKSQINPHFLFNHINNLYSSAIENSPKTAELILELSSVLRYMLYECKAKYVPLEKEITHLKNYINLSKLQIEERGDVHLNIDQIKDNYKIAPIILIVFVENAFKHSASSQKDAISINIELKVNAKGILRFKCCNTYLNDSNVAHLDSGIGLKNVKQRLKLIYPKSHVLKITDEDNYYDVNLTIDLNKSHNQ